MKKIFYLILFCCLIGLSGCAEKSRLSTPLMTVSIDPAGDVYTMHVDGAKPLRAFVRDASGSLVVQPVQWSINDPTVGEFSSATSMNTTFTARVPGNAVITLTCMGISATVDVSVTP